MNKEWEEAYHEEIINKTSVIFGEDLTERSIWMAACEWITKERQEYIGTYKYEVAMKFEEHIKEQEAKLAICVEALENKPGCKQCVNAGCECIVDYEELVNEALEKIK